MPSGQSSNSTWANVGDWCLFLFDRLPKDSATLPHRFSGDAGSLTGWTRDISALAGVFSDPDDRERLVVLAGRDDPDLAA